MNLRGKCEESEVVRIKVYVRVDLWGKFIEICERCDGCEGFFNFLKDVKCKFINLPLCLQLFE